MIFLHKPIILALATILLVASNGLAQTKIKTPDRRVRDVAFSPDGKLLAAGYGFGNVGGITIWNTADQSVIVNLLIDTKDTAGISRITFSQDGKFFAGATDKGDVILWTVGQWRSPKTILRQRGSPKDLTCSRTMLGFASKDVALLYNLNTAEVSVLAKQANEFDEFNGISFTPDEKLVAVSGRRGPHSGMLLPRNNSLTWKRELHFSGAYHRPGLTS